MPTIETERPAATSAKPCTCDCATKTAAELAEKPCTCGPECGRNETVALEVVTTATTPSRS